MIRTAFALLVAAGATALAGCGAEQPAGRPTPAPPLNASVYIDDRAVSVSPGSVGAGPVIILIANQASSTLSLSVASSGPGGLTIARSRPIGSASFSQLSVDLQPGLYTLAADPAKATDAQLASPNPVASAALRVTAQRPSGEGALLTP